MTLFLQPRPAKRPTRSRHPALASGLALLLALLLAGSIAAPAEALTRFGKNVRVGGHDFSNHTFDRKNRGVVHLYRNKPRNAGCAWHRDGRGGRVKVCRLLQLRR